MSGYVILRELNSTRGRLRARPLFWQILICLVVIAANIWIVAALGARRLCLSENFRLEANRDGQRGGYQACSLALLKHPVGAIGVRALRQHERGLEHDLGEARDAILAVDGSAAREVERLESRSWSLAPQRER